MNTSATMMTHKNIEDVFDEFIPKLEELKRAMDKIKFQIETIHKLFKEIPTVLLGFVTKELRKPFDYNYNGSKLEKK